MLKRATRDFQIKCDVCGVGETIKASTFAQVWEAAKRRAWIVRVRDPKVIHVCPECPE